VAVNPMDYSSKDLVLDVVRGERARFFDIVHDPANWRAPTRCAGWEVRDMVGHMIDVTEGYLSRWELARVGADAPAPLGLAVMGASLNEHALALRSLGRDEAIARLTTASDAMLAIFDRLTADEWSGLLVSHPYMGPLPSFFYPAFHVMDYGVHTWDMEWGLGRKNDKDNLDERTAGVLVPYMFILMQYTVDQAAAKGVDLAYGLTVGGEWGGQWRVTVKDGIYTATPVDRLEGLETALRFDTASDLVLTTYQRINASRATGDPADIAAIRRLFFTI
jgi:uncharacterized protein (TIGR03083 family)